jgi:hypothetical protein
VKQKDCCSEQMPPRRPALVNDRIVFVLVKNTYTFIVMLLSLLDFVLTKVSSY